VGTSLFAPLIVLEGPGWETAAKMVGILSVEELPRYWVSLAGISLIAFFLVFPSGRWVPTWASYAVAALGALLVLTTVLPDGPFDPAAWPELLSRMWALGIPLAVVASQVYRTAMLSEPDESLRARPVLVAFVVAVATFAVLWVLKPELSTDAFGLVLATDRLRAIYDVNLLILLTTAVFLFPVSIGFAVFRYRLFDIELVANRALVYGALSALVVLAFVSVASVIVLLSGQQMGAQLTGSQAGIAGAITGAFLVAVFRPARRRIQSIVDRRFYREKYDAEQTVEAFAVRANEVVDLTVLEQQVRDVIFETLHPTGMGLWLREQAGREIDLDLDTQQFLLEAGEAVDLGQAPAMVEHLRAGGYQVACPLISQKELVGALLLGPREGEMRYSSLDLELLDRLCSRAAPAFRMSQLVREQEAEALQRERVAQEMDVARRIQHDLLPREVPELTGWEIDVFYEPAREVGGDFYDFIPLEGEQLAVVVADVADKGVPAAMVMATCRTLLRGAAEGRSPTEVLATVNDLLLPDIPEAMFVTCLYGVLDPSSGRFVFANAGHNLPYVAHDGQADEVRATGMPLGLLPESEYDAAEINVQPGDVVVLSSDGLVEAHGSGREMFGFPRMVSEIENTPRGESIIQNLLDALKAFVGARWEQEDDITLLTVRRLS
ncbi:MAG: SpoIIE family protein phosphatase, partial [Acidimicrobiia bacterium]